MHEWDAGQYLRFANERTQPAIDLAARIDLDRPRRIVDLGCGPGPFLARLSPAEQPDFLGRYAAVLADALPRRNDGRVLLPYPRLFLIATPKG